MSPYSFTMSNCKKKKNIHPPAVSGMCKSMNQVYGSHKKLLLARSMRKETMNWKIELGSHNPREQWKVMTDDMGSKRSRKMVDS